MVHITRTRTRTITDDMRRWFETDLNDVRFRLSRVFDKHKAFEEDVWLGGSKNDNNTEKPPPRATKTMQHLRAAAKLLDQADHEVAMLRAEAAFKRP